MLNTWRWDEPEQVKGLWRTCCRNKDCEWEDDTAHEYQDDCDIAECPECGSEHLTDREENEDDE